MQRPTLSPESGFSLLEMIIAMGAAMFVMVSMMTITSSLNDQNRLIEQKQEMLELKSMMLQTFNQPGVCAFHLAVPTVTVDVSTAVSQASPSQNPTEIQEIRTSALAGAPLLAKKGEVLPGSQTSLKVAKIQLTSLYPTGVADEYRGTIEVAAEQIAGRMALRPARMDISVKTVAGDPSTAKHISSCGSTAAAVPTSTASVQKFCDTYRSGHVEGCASPTADGRCHIPNSETALGCFLTGIDDDTARIGYAGPGGIAIGSSTAHGRVYGRRDLDKDEAGNWIASLQKCEVAPEPSGGGWFYRSWFDCEVITCSYGCIFQ